MMKQCRVFVAILGVLACVGVGRADEDSAAAKMTRIGAVAWDQANLATLQSFGYADVAEFLEAAGVQWEGDQDITTNCSPPLCRNFHMYGFTWADLAGDGQYHLVVVFEPYGTSDENGLSIFTRGPSGKIVSQSIVGMDIHLEGLKYAMIPKVIQDLNGDGRDELIIPTLFYDPGGTGDKAIWPRIYRLANGSYVDASRDFASFYETQILPKVNHALERANRAVANLSAVNSTGGASAPEPTDALRDWRTQQMVLIMTRDKILRVIGRDPTAGLAQARAWITGPDRHPGSAYVVIKDIGDHEDDLKAAQLEMPNPNVEEAVRAWRHERGEP